MPAVHPNTPILIGVGQYNDRLGAPDYRALSPVDLAAAAARFAIADAGAQQRFAPLIDAVVGVRLVADSGSAAARRLSAPFGTSDNFPRSVAGRLGCEPRLAVYSPACGDEPQKLVGEFCERIAAGECRMVLLCGAEAASTQRHAQSQGQVLHWSETVPGQLEDRGDRVGVLRTRHMIQNGMLAPISVYPVLEHARRRRLGADRDTYAQALGALFARFSEVAADHPCAAAPQALNAEAIHRADGGNRMICDPYTKHMVARDAVNLGAALLLTSVGTARELGIDERRWVYLHGYADVHERAVLERADLGASPAMKLAYEAALAAAGVGIEAIDFFDLYSCFPIAVLSACDALGLEPDDPRRLTVTGGLPFFGGPGNNYSMHAIATLVEKLREQPGTLGLIGANGGFMSTHSVGVYSTRPKAWARCDSTPLQQRIDRLPAPAFDDWPAGWATIESYTVAYGKAGPVAATVVARLEHSGARCLAATVENDADTVAAMLAEDPLGRRIQVRAFGYGNRFAFSAERLAQLLPPPSLDWQDEYRHCRVERRGAVLEVTLERPAQGNALTPAAHAELEQVFDCYQRDAALRVAIVTGAGETFCVGDDRDHQAAGKPMWLPRSGFGGLTARRRDKPVIAAVNGPALGGGFELALACDLVVADAGAVFALDQPLHGGIAIAGGVQRLARRLPRQQALELILSGRRLDAAAALQWGLVNRVVPAGGALAAARELAAALLTVAPSALRLSLQLLEDSDGFASLQESLTPHYEAIDRMFAGDDLLEGLTAHAAGRPPRWRGR